MTGAAAAVLLAAAGLGLAGARADQPVYDVLIHGGTIYDGTGGRPFVGDVAIEGDRIAYVGPAGQVRGERTVEAAGKAVSPGFINMLSWATDSLIADGRGQSDLRQGVTLEVFGEGWSGGPLNDAMKATAVKEQGDIRYPIQWTTLAEYLNFLEHKGVSMNVASFVGATTVRVHELGEGDVDPDAAQLARMKTLVRQAMEDGAVGLGSSIIYAPASYAETPELIALASESARCGGMYISHMRSEADRLLPAVDELIEIARQSGGPAEIYHLKQAGRDNWGKLQAVIDRVEAARAQGLRISANMYTYTAGATGLDAAMPTWVQAGGNEAWINRMKDPSIRARVIAEMRTAGDGWENLYHAAGSADRVLFIGFKNPKLKPLIGKTLAEVAAMRGVSPEDAAIDLVIEDGSRVDTVYFLMDEANVARQTTLPWMSFGSDEGATAPEGVFLLSSAHPRAYGNVARLLARYVRDEGRLSLAEAVRKLSGQPAMNLALHDRGFLKVGNFADVVVFDPATVQDHATFERPQQFATGVSQVFVNGVQALKDGEPTGAPSGRVVRGRAWTGWPDGGCRVRASDWTWAWPKPPAA
ncbi:MAG: amidohydrolase family protein [Caulobacteraceae bacterium]|nr:amidohydrolase family protein [Caulobacteraceae bacterium]